MRQEAPTKPCVCGRGKIYTSPIDAKRNYRVPIDGKEQRRCLECMLEYLVQRSIAIVRERNAGRAQTND